MCSEYNTGPRSLTNKLWGPGEAKTKCYECVLPKPHKGNRKWSLLNILFESCPMIQFKNKFWQQTGKTDILVLFHWGHSQAGRATSRAWSRFLFLRYHPTSRQCLLPVCVWAALQVQPALKLSTRFQAHRLGSLESPFITFLSAKQLWEWLLSYQYILSPALGT